MCSRDKVCCGMLQEVYSVFRSSAKTVRACFTSIVASSHDHDDFKLISRQIHRIVPHVVAVTGRSDAPLCRP